MDAWDEHQDQVRRKRIAAEREKTYERQLQHNRIASQSLMVPMVEVMKRTQTSADAFKNVSTAELMKLAALAAKALPGIHKDERQVPAHRMSRARSNRLSRSPRVSSHGCKAVARASTFGMNTKWSQQTRRRSWERPATHRTAGVSASMMRTRICDRQPLAIRVLITLPAENEPGNRSTLVLLLIYS